MGIDYGNGRTNIDHDTDIRYGVIPACDVCQTWSDASEAEYPEPEPQYDEDGEEIEPDMYCDDGCEPIAFNLDDGEYKASQTRDDGDIFILKSPYYTYAPFCSPCAPGACYLRNGDTDGDAKAYCFAPDWFDCYSDDEATGMYDDQRTACPYPVYRISDNVCIFTPKN